MSKRIIFLVAIIGFAACDLFEKKSKLEEASPQVVERPDRQLLKINFPVPETKLPTLYKLPSFEEDRFVTQFDWQEGARADFIRLYAIRDAEWPSDDKILGLYRQQGGLTHANPAAAAVLTSPNTRLLYAGARGNAHVRFPSGTGLPIRSSEGLVAEIAWHPSAASEPGVGFEFLSQRTPLRTVDAFLKETSEVLVADSPRALSASSTLPDNAKLVWFSLIVSEDVDTATFEFAGRSTPLIQNEIRIMDVSMPNALGPDQPIAPPVGTKCSYKLTDSHGPKRSDCGMFLYYVREETQ